jgi:hypothetical protein
MPVALLLGAIGAPSAALAAGPNAIIANAGCQATDLPANDDGSSPSVALPFTINYFGNNFSQLWVNNNGNVTFDGAMGTFTPFSLLGTTRVIIAPFFADVDTRGAGSGTTHYGDISAGATEVGGHQAFCVNWVNVGYFSGHSDKLNSFQLVLVDRSDTGAGNFDIMFNYDQVQWETGDASGGSGGLGGTPARAGFSNGSTASFEIAGSGIAGGLLDANLVSGLIHNNIGSPLQDGRYVFPVRNGAATGHSISGHIWANSVGTPVNGAFISACPTPADTPCRLASSGADGSYSLNNLPDHTSGGGAVDHNWNLIVNPPGGSGLSGGTAGPISVNGSDVTGQDVILHGPTPLPLGASITTPSNGTQTSGTPSVYWGDPITLRILGCTPGTGTATLLVSDGYSQTVPLVEGPSGTYTATFAAPFPHHGNAHISWTLSCGTTGGFDIYIDPSGVVTALDGSVVSGATVTLYRSDDPAGPFVQVPNGSPIMSPGNQSNPDTTNATGSFGWDVLPGFYKVRAAKDGCTAPGTGAAFVETGVLTIPPPVTDLGLVLNCPAAPVGTITVTKDLIPAEDPGKFNLKIDANVVKADAIDGGSSGPITVNVGNHDVSEAGGTNTLLANYTSSISCTEDTNTASPVNGTDAGPVTLPVENGDAWTCIITNTRKSVGGTTITALSPVHAWIGLKNSDDQGTQFDLYAELQKNGTTVASGLTRCITGLTRNPSLAKEAIVNWDSFAPVTVGTGDVLSIMFSTRIGTTSTGAKCPGPGGSHNNAVGLRLYYDSVSQASHFDMTVNNVNSNQYLHSNGGLCGSLESQGVTTRWFDSTAPTAAAARCKDSGHLNFAGGNPFSLVGTWTMP